MGISGEPAKELVCLRSHPHFFLAAAVKLLGTELGKKIRKSQPKRTKSTYYVSTGSLAVTSLAA